MIVKHGAAIGGKSTLEYNSWRSCRQRCYNKNHHRYSSYGKKGITVCETWQGIDGFENFLRDMGERPEPKETYSLERINPYGNYNFENCVWSTAKTQSKNFRARLSKHTCPACKKSFAGMKHAKYCSINCGSYFRYYKKTGSPKKTNRTTHKKKCLVCTISFLGESSQIYCSRKCRETNQLLKKNQKKNLAVKKPFYNFSCLCIICRSSFIAYRPNNKCCSKECFRINRNNTHVRLVNRKKELKIYEDDSK